MNEWSYFLRMRILLLQNICIHHKILSLTVLEDKIPFKPFVLAALEGIYISF